MQRTIVSAILLLAVFICAAHGLAQAPAQQAKDTDEFVLHISDLSVPLSSLLSPEARAYMVHLLRDNPFFGGPSAADDIKGYRASQDAIMRQFLIPMRKRFSVNVEQQKIAGIDVDVITPRNGVSARNNHRVLLNVHGGGFISGAKTASLIESIPIAALGQIKVISIDYRMAPEAQFPAASEDVAVVYQQILKQYEPRNIGLYGCSAGGTLTAQSVAWFDAHNLPQPGAVGVLCASLGEIFGGDSGNTALALNGMAPVPHAANAAAAPMHEAPSYLRNADAQSPLVYPIHSPVLLGRFPPTLFLTSTRAFEFSSAVNSRNALAEAGVESELYVWDGLPHAFWYNSELPESQAAYRAIVQFFDQHLGK